MFTYRTVKARGWFAPLLAGQLPNPEPRFPTGVGRFDLQQVPGQASINRSRMEPVSVYTRFPSWTTLITALEREPRRLPGAEEANADIQGPVGLGVAIPFEDAQFDQPPDVVRLGLVREHLMRGRRMPVRWIGPCPDPDHDSS
jgi:hypothetical protein